MRLKSYKGKTIIISPVKTDYPSSYGNNEPLPVETIKGLQGLGEILRRVHNRLITEGYCIIEGKLYSPQGELLYERNQTKHL